ncbi:carbohydrate ABC transporter permease [Cohnella sp. WQ 127256]|uniref:carbohydrate ABC transporter permease n=1 Tax=Cohnella sp. WQ 127256 TaxID=2938790 RepID=UPI002119918A|nr:carbohydrate ABC transporter permease [Cohnella sp. WQ 127256]
MQGWRKILLEVVSLLISCVIAIPIYLVIVNSFKTGAEASDLGLSLPTKWSIWNNYTDVFVSAKIPQALWNTTILTVVSVFFIIIFCSLSAYFIQRRENRVSKLIQTIIIAGLILPSSIITTYMLMFDLNLVRTYLGVILLYIAGNYAFLTYVYIGFFHSIPRELDEAAIIDGVRPYGLFWRIIFPLLKPVSASVLIIAFMSVWNDFTTPFYFLNTASRFTLSLTVYFFFGQHSSDWNLVFADIIIVSLPVVILYLFLQRYIVEGLTAGAVKS